MTKYYISFIYKDEKKEFKGNLKNTIGKVVDFLQSKGYSFESEGLLSSPVTFDWIKNNPSYSSYLRNFYKMKNGLYYYVGGNIKPAFNKIKKHLLDFGIDPDTIKTEGFETKPRKIRPYTNDYEKDESEDFDPTEDLEPIQSIENPFQQALCILGESGAGKSYTIENILEDEDHVYQFIIPTAATTGLLSQYSSSKNRYIPSRLGRMLIEASNNPDKLYTAVFDECHKSSTIEMINDELLQAISKRRNRFRFISLDTDTEEIYIQSNLETERGNIKIPDNFGFIFISSNARVIGGNPDFFNRVDLVEITEENRSQINSSKDLIDLSLDNRSDKLELINKMRSI